MALTVVFADLTDIRSSISATSAGTGYLIGSTLALRHARSVSLQWLRAVGS